MCIGGLCDTTCVSKLWFALNDVLSIDEITFDVHISVANGGSFDGTVKGTILGADVNVVVNINVYDIVSTAKTLAEEVIDGLSAFF